MRDLGKTEKQRVKIACQILLDTGIYESVAIPVCIYSIVSLTGILSEMIFSNRPAIVAQGDICGGKERNCIFKRNLENI